MAELKTILSTGGVPDIQSTTNKVGDVAGNNYQEVKPNGTRILHGDARTFDDLRVSIESMHTDGAVAPEITFFKNQGGLPATKNALYFLSQSAGALTIPNNAAYDFTTDFTLDFWYKFDSSTADYTHIFDKLDILRIRHITSGKVKVRTPIGSTTSDSVMIRNTWNHFVVVYTVNVSGDDSLVLYVNGKIIIAQSGPGIAANNSNDLKFNSQFTVMALDNVAFIQRAYTEAEVLQSYNNGNGLGYTGNETDAKGVWKLNELSGNIAADSSAVANPGTISGVENTDFKWDLGVVTSIQGTIGTRVFAFPPDKRTDVFFSVQIPHKWAEGTPFRPHVHVVALSPTETNSTPLFELEYTIATFGGTFGDTVVINSQGVIDGPDTVQYKHQGLTFPDIDMTGMKLSTMIICRLSRIPQDIGDTYTGTVGLLEFDFHYEIDSDGSDTQWVK